MYYQDKLKVVKYIKDFIFSLEEIVINYPNKEMVIKNKFHSDSLAILEYVYLANNCDNKSLKDEYQSIILSKINMLDFYLEKSYKKKYISEKLCRKKLNELLIINKMIYNWKNNV